MRKLAVSATAVAFAAVAAVATATTGASAGTGNGAPSGQHYNLNLIGFANGQTTKTTTGTGGNVIFVPLSGHCEIDLAMGSFAVLDNNCTDGTSAQFQLPNPDVTNSGTTTYSVFVRALGKPGNTADMKTCAYDPGTGETVCSVTTVSLKSTGKQSFANVSKQLLYVYADIDNDGTLERVPLFGSDLQDYFWSYDNQGLRLAQLRFYPGVCTEVPSATNPDGTQNIVDCS